MTVCKDDKINSGVANAHRYIVARNFFRNLHTPFPFFLAYYILFHPSINLRLLTFIKNSIHCCRYYTKYCYAYEQFSFKDFS